MGNKLGCMAWKVTNVMKQRQEFVADWMSGMYSVTALCNAYGVSRKTGYKILKRFLEEDQEGLRDRSRARHHHPNGTPSRIEAEIVRIRRKHGWGGRKIAAYLRIHGHGADVPARSTIDAILHRRGLTKPRRRRRRVVDVEASLSVAQPNDRWCADFKGWFRCQDQQRCDPLTITDSHSRYLLRCKATRNCRFEAVKPQFVRAFREFGLPRSIRTDNGSPFATRGIGGLSRLSAWFVRLGICPDLIEPGKPQQNGKHERMHRTLKAKTATPPRASLRAQQRAFDLFRQMFNEERPHEGIDDAVPAERYIGSDRPYPTRLPALEYPGHFIVRKVSSAGRIRIDGAAYFIGRVLGGQYIGLEPATGDTLTVHFGAYAIGTMHQPSKRILNYRKPIPMA